MSPRRATSDAGFTLVETLITVLVMGIVLAAAFPVLPVFFRESNIVQNTYASVDQLVLASEVATRYVHEAVSPSETANPFLSASSNAVTFYANTGNANGPDEVVMQVATSGTTRTFQVNLYDPLTPTQCPFTLSSTTSCTYGSSTQSYLLINYLTNGTGGSPVFTYTLQGGSTCGGPPPSSGSPKLTSALTTTGSPSYTSLSVSSLPGAVATGDQIIIGTGSTTQTVTVASPGAAANATSIPVTSFKANANYPVNTFAFDSSCSATQMGEIEAVALSLDATKNPGGQSTGYQTLAYLLSPNYATTVG